MTQAKLKSSDVDETSRKKNFDPKEEPKWKYLNDKCVQIAAWVLLTLGLCIIICTFYLAINQHDGNNTFADDKFKDDKNDIGDKYSKNEEGLNVSLISRIMEDKIVQLENTIVKGCEVKMCKIICIHARDVYTELFESMELSNCTFLDTLVIYNQEFEDGILRNNWHYAERTIQEITFINSPITVIRSTAFDTPIFSTTFLLYWRNLNLHEVESGALLGLRSLKYLMIDTKLNCLDHAFFQPVQGTLVYLKLNAELTVNTNENIFGTSKMDKLEYVDMSRNNFNGLITSKAFESIPNLKYLIMSRNKITAISPNAFTHLIGKLFLLDFSHNMLTTLDYGVLGPLLKASSRTFVNFAMNGWICNCDIRPLIKVYREYRGQFMDGLYCKAPHSLYGKFIDEANLENENCEGTISIFPENARSDETDLKTDLTPFSNETYAGTSDYSDYSTPMEPQNIHLRCYTVYDSVSNGGVIDRSDTKSIETLSNSEATLAESSSVEPLNPFDLVNVASRSDITGSAVSLNYFYFQPPDYQFELHLFENNSVKITILRPYPDKDLNILWFDEDINESSRGNTPCLRYADPYVVTPEPLETNKTYTFCYVYNSIRPISPFNCLPLHVPSERIINEDIWIPRDQKPLTIGMLCLIFFVSTFTGAIIAYFGIKTYPDLLEGSKNVLVVKKSDQTCYVSTISEQEYMKKSSLKKKSSRSSMQSFPNQSKSAVSHGSSVASDLTRLSSVKSSSTCFEDAFPSSIYVDDEYEMPKPVDKAQLTYETRSIPNTYVERSPCRSPPPLPKRNSKSFSENIY